MNIYRRHLGTVVPCIAIASCGLLTGCSALGSASSASASIKKACSEIPEPTKPGVTVGQMKNGLLAAYLEADKAVMADTGQSIDSEWKLFKAAVQAEGALWVQISKYASPDASALQGMKSAPESVLTDYPIVEVSSTITSTCLVVNH